MGNEGKSRAASCGLGLELGVRLDASEKVPDPADRTRVIPLQEQHASLPFWLAFSVAGKDWHGRKRVMTRSRRHAHWASESSTTRSNHHLAGGSPICTRRRHQQSNKSNHKDRSMRGSTFDIGSKDLVIVVMVVIQLGFWKSVCLKCKGGLVIVAERAPQTEPRPSISFSTVTASHQRRADKQRHQAHASVLLHRPSGTQKRSNSASHQEPSSQLDRSSFCS